MPKSEKITAVSEIRRRLQENDIAILTKYIGINVAQVTELRSKLRAAGVEFKVYKNTLGRLALRELGLEAAADFMEGPTAWAFSKDPVAPAKILKEFSGNLKFVSMVGGVLEGKVVTKAQLESLASMPGRDQLRAQLIGTIAAPLRSLAGVLNALPRNLVNVLDQIRKQKEAGSAQAA